MQLSSVRFISSLRKFIHARFADAGFASDEEAALAVSTLLEIQAMRSPGEQEAVYSELSDLLNHLRLSLSLAETAPHLADTIKVIEGKISAIDRSKRIEIVQGLEKVVLQKVEALVEQIAGERALDAKERDQAVFRIAQWDFDRVRQHSKAPVIADTISDPVITRDSLAAYLRDRFEDPHLQLEAFSTAASGGFGKQTILFESSGKLAGSFVIRRDRPAPLLSNDCHLVTVEYPVIKAVSETGFPAPETMWLDVDHAMLPGSHFFVMRRSPGKVQGTVFGGTGVLPKQMVMTFAEAVGRLHRLDPLVSLGDLNESITRQLWSLPLTEVVRRYITGYREYFLQHRISNAPSLAAVYGWLLDNVPVCDDRPVLVHGDMGLHNLLFDGDDLSVVLDWEQAHIGDPMEDLGYIRNTANTSLDWPLFVERYEATSGNTIDGKRLHFQQVWSQAKNATGAALTADLYASGKSDDFNLAHLGLVYFPIFIGEAMRLIEEA